VLKGLDVSSVQGKVDWTSVASMGCEFAFLKCSEGNKGTDPIFNDAAFLVDAQRAAGVMGRDIRFLENVSGARKNGLLVAPYHFAYPLPHQEGNPLRDPAAQAKFAFDCAEGLGSQHGELPPMLDLEWPEPTQWNKWGCNATQIIAWALEYLDAAGSYWGCAPVIYTYPDFWTHLGGAHEPLFAGYPLCIANYLHPTDWPKASDRPHVLSPWTDWTFWQFTGGQMRLPNGTPCDFEVFNGDGAALRALAQ
jgi:GH25 family lysozyme M1 (1,4-beta-N-acetylmuramidase)